VASRKEQKEALKADRLEAERQAKVEDRRKRIVGLGVAGVMVIGVLAVIGILIATSGGASGNAHIVNKVGFTTTAKAKPDDRAGTKSNPGALATNLAGSAKAAGCTLVNPADAGNRHLSPGEATPKYKTNPPTSGAHDPVPLADGAYATAPPLRHAVHSLEHGRVEIQYSPKLPLADQLKLKGVFDENFRYMILFPNPTMRYQVAEAAWGHYLGCPRYSPKVLDAVRAFRDTYVGNGPEGVGSQPSA
jgi:hypothetical protein